MCLGSAGTMLLGLLRVNLRRFSPLARAAAAPQLPDPRAGEGGFRLGPLRTARVCLRAGLVLVPDTLLRNGKPIYDMADAERELVTLYKAAPA